MPTRVPDPAAAAPLGSRPVLRMAARLTLFCVVFALCMLLCEAGVRVLGYQPIYRFYSKPSVFWQYDPVLGWAHTPNSRGVYIGPKPWPVEFHNPVEINSDGLRGPEITPVPPGGRRVLFIGDSMLAAFEVEYERTFPALIGQMLTEDLAVPVQVVNAGVRGYGTDQSYLYFRERGRKLQPDAVVLVYSGNDPRENSEVHRMQRPLGKPVFKLDPGGSLELMGTPVPSYPLCSQFGVTPRFAIVREDTTFERVFCILQTSLLEHSALGTVVTFGLRRHPKLLAGIHFWASPPAAFGVTENMQEETTSITEALLRALGADVLRETGRRLLVIGDDRNLVGFDRRRIADFVDVFSYEAVWSDRKDEINFKNDQHFTVLGHERVARLVAPLVAERLRTPRAGGPE